MGTVWRQVQGRLKYVSCGLYGCWGVNKHNHVYFRAGITSINPLGEKWVWIMGIALAQIESGPGGFAAGVKPDGTVMMRTGVTRDRPYGEAWKNMDSFNIPAKHVTVSLNKIFIVSLDGDVYETLLEKTPDMNIPEGSEGKGLCLYQMVTKDFYKLWCPKLSAECAPF